MERSAMKYLHHRVLYKTGYPFVCRGSGVCAV
jgi:hypothetical protein